MCEDKFKKEIAKVFTMSINILYPELEVTFDEIYNRLQRPKKIEHGQWTLPLFEYAKKLGIDPIKMCKKLVIIDNLIAEGKICPIYYKLTQEK